MLDQDAAPPIVFGIRRISTDPENCWLLVSDDEVLLPVLDANPASANGNCHLLFQALNGYRRSFNRSQVVIVGLATIDQVNLDTRMPLLQPLA